MEDAHIAHIEMEGGVSLFGVFDGHGGKYDLNNSCIKTYHSSWQPYK